MMNITLVTVGTILAAIAVATVISNGLVLLCFVLEKKLRTHRNYFFLSLAVSDILIGFFSMPFYIQYLMIGKWTLGNELCDTWLAQDYMCCNASRLNLLMIGFDRYFSIVRPLQYRAQNNSKRVFWMIICAWTISFLTWPPWIYSWQYIDGERTVPNNRCYVQFLETNSYVTLIKIILDYYLPLFIMLILYHKIWRKTKERKKHLADMKARNYNKCISQKLTHVDRKKKRVRSCLPCYFRPTEKEQNLPNNTEGNGSIKSIVLEPMTDNSTGAKPINDSSMITNKEDNDALCASYLNTNSYDNAIFSGETTLSKETDRKQMRIKNDIKAMRVLLAIIIVFILTTTPYNIVVIVKNLTDSFVPDALWNFCYYVFYINSLLNPLCYVLTNQNFKKTYKKILFCAWNKKTHSEYSIEMVN